MTASRDSEDDVDTDTVTAEHGLWEATAVPSQSVIEGELSHGLSILRHMLSSPQTAAASNELQLPGSSHLSQSPSFQVEEACVLG